jgi:hypothetical protein
MRLGIATPPDICPVGGFALANVPGKCRRHNVFLSIAGFGRRRAAREMPKTALE